MTAKTIPEEWVSVDLIRPSPHNPRLFMREDRIERFAEAMQEAGYDAKYPLLVRPVADGFEVVDGHHRLAAAKQAGVEKALAKIVDLDDMAALDAQLPSNDQDGWIPVEIGLYFLEREKVSAVGAGRGNEGGERAYARRLEKSRTYVRECIAAARVATAVKDKMDGQPSILGTKTQHLAAIHALPVECWAEAVQLMLAGSWSAKETGERVKGANIERSPKVIVALLAGKTSRRELDRIDEIRDQVRAALEYDDLRAKWDVWFDTADPFDVKTVQAKRIEIEDMAFARREAEREQDKRSASSLPNLVLADPPWRYDFAETDSRQIENQYPSATVDEIIAHRPETAPDCALFLWATVAKLREALEVMDGWGFTYKTQAVWDKEKIGMGYWFRGQHELLLVGTRGAASPPEAGDRVSSVFREARGAHSEKPECVYEWIERAFPAHVKLEMYSRKPRAGWLAFGNEVANAA